MSDIFFKSSRGLFFFCDPGAAKAVLAFVYFLKKKGYEDYVIISNRNHSFYKEFNLDVRVIDEKEIQKIIYNFQPKYIFTGTSYSSSFELLCLKHAKKLNITSFSFVDHWTSISERFKLKTRMIYPDSILVIDQRAKDIAINEGVPKNLLSVFSNPYFKYLKKWQPTLTKKNFFEQLKLNDNSSPVLSYLAEPLSNVGGITKYGIDEYLCLEILQNTLSKIDSKIKTILVKLHPNQNKVNFKNTILKKSINNNIKVKIVECDINSLIFYSDIIVGIFSNALLEAMCFKKPIIRILKGLKIEDPFESLNVGNTVYSEEELAKNLMKF